MTARPIGRLHRRDHIRRSRFPRVVPLSLVLAVFAVSITASGLHDPESEPTPILAADFGSLSEILPLGGAGSGSGSGSGKLVFAHYFPPYPISIDNNPTASDYYTVNYLNPNGEGGVHSAYGGLLRDRPLGRSPQTGSDWRIKNLEEEVRQAKAAGIDGFTIDILYPKNYPNWMASVPQDLLTAARNVDPAFKIMLMPDMNGTLSTLSPQQLASEMATYARSRSAFKLADGRLVVSPFMASNHPAWWWNQFMQSSKTTRGVPIAFVPLFLDELPYLAEYAPISYGIASWGARSPALNPVDSTGYGSARDRADRVHALGLKWMPSVSFQDERPSQGVYDEAENTQNLRNTWQNAIDTNADWVQLVTWNDYSEGAAFAPSIKHGWSPLDMSSYYATWYKAGVAPTISRDTVYLSSRTQLTSALPQYPETMLMNLRPGGSPARDSVEAVALLIAPATVAITMGDTVTQCSVPAGVSVCTAPLGIGTAQVRVVRNGTETTAVTSPHTVTAAPYVQDLQYTAVSSGREGTRTSAAFAPSKP